MTPVAGTEKKLSDETPFPNFPAYRGRTKWNSSPRQGWRKLKSKILS
jgi:hypothetical protein